MDLRIGKGIGEFLRGLTHVRADVKHDSDAAAAPCDIRAITMSVLESPENLQMKQPLYFSSRCGL